MSLLKLTETLDTQSVILSREITKLEDVYSLIDVVEEKLRLDIRLTLLLLESDFETKIEEDPVLDIKTEVKETEEVKENQEPSVKSDDSEEDLEDADDPSFKPKYQEAINKTVRATSSKKSTKLKEDSTGETLCNECGKMYANARQLMRHKKTVFQLRTCPPLPKTYF